MLLTIPTTNVTLDWVLTQTQKDIARQNTISSQKVNNHTILIQNLWVNDLYIDFWTPALVTEAIQIPSWSTFTFKDFSLKDCNLISDIANNTNVRVLLN